MSIDNSGENHIPKEKVWDGMLLSLRHAHTFRDQSKFLHDSKKFLGAIPLATISFEESLKAESLLIKFANKNGVTFNEWNELKTHKSKLEKMNKEMIESVKHHPEVYKGGRFSGLGSNTSILSVGDLIKKLEEEKSDLHGMQKLRERCFYSDWNDSKQNWESAIRLNAEDLKSLSSFMLNQTEKILSHIYFVGGGIFYITGMAEGADPYRIFKENDFVDVIKRLAGENIAEDKIIDKGFQIFRRLVSH